MDETAPPRACEMRPVAEEAFDAAPGSPDGPVSWTDLPRVVLERRHLMRNRLISATRENPAHSAFVAPPTKLVTTLREKGWRRDADRGSEAVAFLADVHGARFWLNPSDPATFAPRSLARDPETETVGTRQRRCRNA